MSPPLFAVGGFGSRVGARRLSDLACLQASNSPLELGELVELRPVAANELADGTVELGLATEDLVHGPTQGRSREDARLAHAAARAREPEVHEVESLIHYALRMPSNHGSALWGAGGVIALAVRRNGLVARATT